jgi:hypothetical protein
MAKHILVGHVMISIDYMTEKGSGIMRRLLRTLHQEDILSHDLSVPEDLDDLETSYRGLCQMRKGGKQRRIGELIAWPFRFRSWLM